MEGQVMQMATREERETHIWVDYPNGLVKIYTNVATVMNRLEREGIKFTEEEKIDEQVFGRRYELLLKDIGLVSKKRLFFTGGTEV